MRDGGERSRTVDYVRDEVADRMIERLMVSTVYVDYEVWSLRAERCISGHQEEVQDHSRRRLRPWSFFQVVGSRNNGEGGDAGVEWY